MKVSFCVGSAYIFFVPFIRRYKNEFRVSPNAPAPTRTNQNLPDRSLDNS